MKQVQIFISRYHVEFGPFAPFEVIGLCERAVFTPSDFAREAGSDRWVPMMEWRRGWTMRHRGPQPKPRNVPTWMPPRRRLVRKPAARAENPADY